MMHSGGRPGKFQISVPVLDLYPQITFLKGKEVITDFQFKNQSVVQASLFKIFLLCISMIQSDS